MTSTNDEELGIDIVFLLNTIRRRFGIIIAGTALAVILAAVYVVLVPERYTSSAKVLFDPSGIGTQGSALTNIPRARIESEIEIARSGQNFIRVILDEDLLEKEQFLPKKNPLIEFYNAVFDVRTTQTEAAVAMNVARNRLGEAVTIRQVGLSSVIDFMVETEDPELSAQVANALADAYINFQIETKVQSSNKTLSVIQDAIALARENLEKSQVALVGYLEDNATFISEQTGNLKIGLIAQDLKSNQSTLDDIAATQLQLEKLIQSSDFDALGVEVLGGLSTNLLDELQAEAYQQLESRRKSLIQQRQETNAPENIEEELAAIELQLSGLATDRVEALVALAGEQRRDLLNLNSQLETEIFGVDLPPAIAAELFSLQSTAQSSRAQYSNLLDQAELLAIQAQTQIADSRVIGEAIASLSASFPNRNLILAVAMILGFGVTAAIVVIFEVYAGGFSSAGQLRDYVGLKDVVEIPKENGEFSVIDLIGNNPFSPVVERFRAARTLLELSILDNNKSETDESTGGKVVAMMSSMPAEGKSTLAMGVGLVCAGTGVKVCIVDLDFRRPQLATRTGLKPQSSLMTYLKAGKTLPKPQNFKIKGLAGKVDVLTTDFDNSAMTDQLFFGENFGKLISELRQKYDYVILDTAPVLSVAASRLVYRIADNIAFCIRANSTNKRLVNDTINSLKDSGELNADPVLVLSQTSNSNNGYYYQGYSEYRTETNH